MLTVCYSILFGQSVSEDLQVAHGLLFESTHEELEQSLKNDEMPHQSLILQLVKGAFLSRASFSLIMFEDLDSSFAKAPLRNRFLHREVNYGDRLRSVVLNNRCDLEYFDPDNQVSCLCDLLRCEGESSPTTEVEQRVLRRRLISLVGGNGRGKTRGLLEAGLRFCIQSDSVALYISYGSEWTAWPLGEYSHNDFRKRDDDLACRIAFAFYRQVLIPACALSEVEWEHFPKLFPSTVWSLSGVTEAILRFLGPSAKILILIDDFLRYVRL